VAYDVDQPVDEQRLLVEQAVITKGTAQVPVAGMQNSHASTVRRGCDSLRDTPAIAAILATSWFRTIEVDMLRASLKELAIIPSFAYGCSNGRDDLRQAPANLMQLQASLSGIVTHTFSLSEVSRAFETAADKSTGAIKVAVVNNES